MRGEYRMTGDSEGRDDEASEAVPITKGRSTRAFGLAAAAIVILSGILYLPSMHGSMIWDDTFLIKGTGLSGATAAYQCFSRAFLWNYYRPLTGASFVLEHRLWGQNTFGYHVTNVLLHLLTTAILIPVLLTAFRSRRIAICGAALFAVQPLQVSTVAWIGGRTDSLCTFFIVLFWLALLRGAKGEGVRRTLLLSVSFLLYVAAAFAKEQALVLAPLVPLALYVFRPGSVASGASSNSEVELPSAPARIKSRFTEMALWTVPFVLFAPYLMIEWKRFGDPIRPHWNFAFQFPAVGRTIDYYVILLLAPTPRMLHTWTLGEISKSGPISILIGYMIAAAAIVAFVRWMRTEPVLAWFFAATVLLLFPVSNIWPLVTQVVAPYRAGTAGLAAPAVVGWAIVKLWDRIQAASPSGRQPVWFAIPVVTYLMWLGCLTFWDTHIWVNQLLASSAVEHYDPTSSFGTLEVAASYLDLRDTDPAIARLDKMMETVRNRKYTVVRSDSAIWWMYGGYPSDWIGELYGRAGMMKLDKGDRQSALLLLNKGDKLSPSNEIVRAGLANCAFSVHDVEGGIKQLRILLKYRPKLTDDRIVLAQVLWKTNQWSDADSELIKCIQKRPMQRDLYLMDAVARIHLADRPGALAVLNSGLQNGALDSAPLRKWLASIGESSLMN